MTRMSIKAAVVALSAAALIAVPGGLAATPQQIYADYADNGQLDGTYSQADLNRALQNAAVQGYLPNDQGLKPEAEGGKPSAGGEAGEAGGAAGAPAAVESTGGLPFTGLDLGLIAAGAAGLLLLGVGLRRVARQRH